MDHKPRISVIMGIYNCANTLQEALNCLYKQTYQDFEIILCDDGSADNTYELAKKNAEQHPNIKLLKNSQNQGLNKTLNNCLAVAEGDYIARMDGDDLCDSTRFEKEVRFLDEHPEYAIVSTPMIYFDEEGEFGKGKGGYEPTKMNFLGGPPFCHATCMVRREAYQSVDGYSEDPRLLRVEDYHLWMKMFMKGFRGYMLDECLYSMRDDRNATIRRKPFKFIKNEVYACFLACKNLKLPLWSFIYCIKPILVYLMPIWLYDILHKKQFDKHLST